MSTASHQPQQFLEAFGTASPYERYALVEGLLRALVVDAIQTDASEVLDDQQDLSALGMDSILAVEVVDDFTMQTGVRIGSEVLFQKRTLASLCAAAVQAIEQHLCAPLTASGPGGQTERFEL